MRSWAKDLRSAEEATSEKYYYNANFNLKFCMLAHSASSELVRETLGLQPQAAPNTIIGHSIHLIGINDPGKPKSEAEALIFKGGSTRLVVYHAGAHELPRELETNELLYIRVMTRIGESLKPESLTHAGVTAKVVKFKNRLMASLLREELAIPLEEPSEVAVMTKEAQREQAEEAFPPSLPPSPPLASSDASNKALSIDKGTSRRSLSRRLPSMKTMFAASQPIAAEKEVTFPGFMGTPGAVCTIQQAEGEKTFLADHLVVPTTANTLPWQPISKFSSVSVSPLQQLVRVKISPEADNHPCTLRGLLTARPYDAPCIRTASDPSISLTYGQLHDFMAPGKPLLFIDTRRPVAF